MLPLPFPNPPTMSSLSDARSSLETSIRSQEALATEISDAEANLAKVIQEAQCRIDALRREKTQLDEQILATQAYISPMRRLPIELLRDVFYGCFEDHPCCAWVLASVCVDWRRLALAMPRIWAKVSIPFRCSILLPPSVVVWRYGGSFRCFFVVRGSETSGCLTSHGHADLVDNAFIFSVPVLTGRGL
jgi:hypothetical protein